MRMQRFGLVQGDGQYAAAGNAIANWARDQIADVH